MQYNQAVQLIKSAILQNQLEAAKAVNRQMLAPYYDRKSPANGGRFAND